MNFFESKFWLDIAELIEEFFKKKNNSIQYSVVVNGVSNNKELVEEALEKELKNGSKYVNIIDVSLDKKILIFEKVK